VDEQISPALVRINGCEGESHEPCDIRDARCQTAVLSLTLCLRGNSDGVDVATRVISKGEYRAELQAQYAESEYVHPTDYETALWLLGLVEAGALDQPTLINESADFVTGFYSARDQRVTVIDTGDPLDDAYAASLLLHEYVHALQDQDYQLESFWNDHVTSYDTSLAVSALREGEARLYESLAFAAFAGLNVRALDLDKVFESAEFYGLGWLLEQPSPYTAAWRSFPYTVGARYAYLAWRSGGHEAVDAQWDDPPVSTLRLMASDETIAPEPDATAPAEPAVAVDLQRVEQTTLGALGVAMFARGEPLDTVRQVAGGWRGDRLWVHARDDEVAVSWQLFVSDESTATELVSIGRRVFATTQPYTRVEAEGASVWIIAATQDALVGELALAFGLD
jgi:hypothetical protein